MTDLPHRLREALLAADFDYETVAELLGPLGHAALGRNETTPGMMATRGATPVETLIRLFLLQTAVPTAAAEAALPGLVDRLAVEGVLEQSVGEVGARLDVRPYASEDDAFWVVSDLTPGLDGLAQRVGADHVLGISAASTSLAQLTLREEVGSALDLGTGCGVQALHLARHSRRVVATDVNRRALRIARLNVALNDVEDRVEIRDGSYFEPVAGERFDLVATNPPFVISPTTLRDGSSFASSGTAGARLVYRDSGLPGDRVVEDIVRAAPGHLAPDGWCQVLANWVVTRDQAWDERLAGWLDPGCDALVVQREVLDPAAYVELWLKDEGTHPATSGGDPASAAAYRRRYDTWLSWFDEQGVEGVGFGWVNLHRRPEGAGTGPAVRSLLDWPYDLEQPIAPAIASWGRAVRRRVGAEDHLVARADVRQETVGAPGAEDPEVIVLRQQLGFRRARQVDTVEAALVGACDGDLSVGQVLDALAVLTDREPEDLRARYLPVVGDLVAEGFLT